MNTTQTAFRGSFWLLIVLGFVSSLHSQSLTDLPFPADPSLWINTASLDARQLSGKGVVLWYFEETCPRCRAKWPELLKFAESHRDDPVVFIAVSSGTQRNEIMRYAKDVGLNWPVLLDPMRVFEKASDVGEISLQNIYQIATINGSGRFRRANPADLEGVVEQALEDASWKIDPATIADEVKPIWQLVELGDYAKASAGLRTKGLAKSPEAKQSIEKLNSFVMEQMQAEIDAVDGLDETDKWERYKASKQIMERFAGFEIPKDFVKAGSELHKSKEVKAELAAQQQLMKLEIQLQRATNPEAARRSIEGFLKKHPDTEAATTAQQWLSKF